MPPADYLEERETLTRLLFESPYHPGLYLERARCYEHLGFPDLASGDAYRALLLTDEAQDESGEYHELVLEALSKARNSGGEGGEMNGACKPSGHISNGHGPASDDDEKSEDGSEDESEDEENMKAAHEIATTYARQSYQKLARNLTRCGCLRTAFDFCQRGSTAFPKDDKLKDMLGAILAIHRETQLQQDPSWDESSFDPKISLPDQGSVRRELYPWNTHEPDRFSATSLAVLNRELHQVAPNCEVRSVSLPLLTSSASASTPPATVRQLGLFATADICPGELVLSESSILTANNRHLHPLCDACSCELPPISSSQDLHACPSCPDTVFCSATCATLSHLYHPAICGKDVDAIGKDSAPGDATNALYLLLLGRTIALAETQSTHPLDLPATKYLCGDFLPPNSAYLHSHSPSPSALSTAPHLPFHFASHILHPLHLLSKMDVDIYQPEALARYDTWVLNTLCAKFRGTASARLSVRDGRPEVCAVHPMWALANHSCDPNVRWEWGGRIEFWARAEGERVGWGGGRGEGIGKVGGEGLGKGGGGGGIRKGEEIRNHYCDVELPVRERREWALGALGGVCACERCVWEEAEGRGKEKDGGSG